MLVLSLACSCLGCVTQHQDLNGKSETTWVWPFGHSKQDGKRLPKADTEVAFGDYKVRESQISPQLTPVERERMLEQARCAYQRAQEIDSNSVTASIGLGHVYSLLGNYERAISCYQEALKRHPREARLWFELGMCHGQRKEFDAAIPCFQKALSLDPDNRSCATSLGLCLARAGKFDQSLQVLTHLNGEAKAHLQIARMCEHMQQPEAARSHLQIALQQDPRLAESAQIQELLVRLQGSPESNPALQGAPAAPPVVNVGFREGVSP